MQHNKGCKKSQICKVWSERVYVRIPRKEIGYFKFILESYENLCYMSVIDRFEAIVKVSFLIDQLEEIRLFLQGLSKEIGLEVVYNPSEINLLF